MHWQIAGPIAVITVTAPSCTPSEYGTPRQFAYRHCSCVIRHIYQAQDVLAIEYKTER